MIYAYSGPDEKYKDRELSINKEEALWLARAVVGEAGKRCTKDAAAAVMWALVNRYLLHPAVPKWYKLAVKYGAIVEGGSTFIATVRMFSQPVNPRWARGGDKAKKFPRFATEQRFKRREETTTMQWADMPTQVKRYVTDFVNGELERPSQIEKLKKQNISDWASLKSTPTRFPWGCFVGKNWFFENRALAKGTVERWGIDA